MPYGPHKRLRRRLKPAAPRSSHIYTILRHTLAVVFGLLVTRFMLSGTFQWDNIGNHLSVAIGDASLCAWTMETVLRALLGNPGYFVHAGMFFPLSWTLAFTDHLLGVQPLYAAIRIFTSNVILSFNLVLILSTALCFFSMYVYLHAKLKNSLATILGSCAFAFANSRLAQFGHMQLVVLFYMPIAILALEKSLETGLRSWRCLFVVLASLQFMAAFYLGYPFLVYTSLHGIVFCCYRTPRAPHFKRLTVDLLAVCLIVSLFSWPYVLIQKWYDHRGDLTVIIDNSADPMKSYLSAPIQNAAWGKTLSAFQARQMPHEKWLFPGASVYALLLCALYLFADKKRYRHPLTTAWVSGAAVLFVLSLGPVLVLNGARTHLRLPYLLLYYLVPGFSSMSVPARIGLTWMFPVACLTAFGLDAIMYSLKRKGLTTLATVCALCVIAAFLFESRFTYEQFLFPSGGTVPAVYSWLRNQPIVGGVLDWPVDGQAFTRHEYMYFQLFSRKPTVHGYSGLNPQSYYDILSRFEDPDYNALRYLKALDISTIVYHRRGRIESHWQQVEDLRRKGFLRMLYSDAETTAYDNTVPLPPAGSLQLDAQLPDYVDTAVGRGFDVTLSVLPHDGVWRNPAGRDGVTGRVVYANLDGRRLRLKDQWLKKVKNAAGALEESLKLLPLAAMDGEVVYPSSASMMDALSQSDASGLRVRWEIDQRFGHFGPFDFSIRPAGQFRREFQKRLLRPDIRITASHNNAEIAEMFDGDLSTRWTSKCFMAAGMYIEMASVSHMPISRFCLWLGSNYIDYPPAFRILEKLPDGTFRDVPYHFGIVGQPNKPLENRLEVRLERPVENPVRIEIRRAPTEGKWWWSVSEIEVN